MFLPVALRELGALARGTQFRRRRWQTGVAGLGLFLLAVLAARVSGVTSFGPQIFEMMAWAVWFACLVAGITVSADTISQERREGTLGLLFLTPLRAWDVVVGKLASGAATVLQGLLAVVPMAMCCLAFGGIISLQVAVAVVVWLTTLVLALSVGIFVSSTQTDDRTSASLSFSLLFGMVGLPYALANTFPTWAIPALGTETGLRFMSPAFPVQVLNYNIWRVTLNPAPLVASLLFLNGVSGLLLWATTRRLRRVALANPARRLRSAFESLQHWWQFGSTQARTLRRRRLLDHHPLVWLGLRNRQKEGYVWAAFLLVGLLFVVIAWSLAEGSVVPNFLPLYTLIMMGVLKLWLISEVCTRLHDDRRSGALELMLTTPTSHRDWISGQAAALRTLFGKPIRALGCVAVLLIGWHGLRAQPDEMPWGAVLVTILIVVAVAALDLAALYWGSLWQALRSKTLNGAVSRVYFLILFAPYVLGLVLFLLWLWAKVNWSRAGSNPGPDRDWTQFDWLLAWAILNSAVAGVALAYCRPRVVNRFREIVANGPVDPSNESPTVLPTDPGRSGWSRARFRLRTWVRRRPILAAITTLVLVLGTFTGVRNHLWDQRVAAARESMWLPGISRNMPAEPANPPELRPPVTAFLTEARSRQNGQLKFKKGQDIYAATNREDILTQMKPFLSLAELATRIPDGAVVEARRNPGWGWQPPSLPGHSVMVASQVLDYQAHWALEDHRPDVAMSSLRAIFRLAQMADESLREPHTFLSSSTPTVSVFNQPLSPADDLTLRGVEAIRRDFLSSDLPARDLSTLSNLLARMDTWTNANQRIRVLPIFLSNLFDHPEMFGTPAAMTGLQDLATIQRRSEATDSFHRLSRILGLLTAPETPRLQGLKGELTTWDTMPGIEKLSGWANTALVAYLQRGETLGVVRCARAALIVEEFRRQEHRLPRDQAEISQWQDRAWPVDPFNGDPIHYEPSTNGYSLNAKLNQAQAMRFNKPASELYTFRVIRPDPAKP